MKKTALLLLALVLVSTNLRAAGMPLDASKSKITWTGKKVLGEHTGTVKIKDFTLETTTQEGKTVPVIAADHPAKIVVDMTTIADEDLKDADSNAKLVGHLKSEDFFDVAKFPTATLVVTEIAPRDQQKNDGFTHTLKGKLTIKNITHDVAIPVKITQVPNLWRAEGKLTVDRTQYDIRYRSGKFFEGLGDKIIKDEFEIGFDLTVLSPVVSQ